MNRQRYVPGAVLDAAPSEDVEITVVGATETS